EFRRVLFRSLDVGGEHRHAGIAEVLHQALQGDGLAGAGGAGDQAVAVGQVQRLADRLAGRVAAENEGRDVGHGEALATVGCREHSPTPARRKKRSPAQGGASVQQRGRSAYIMPPMPPMPPMSGMAGAALSSGRSATTASVVIIRPAMEAAACSALRVTLAGSRMPISIMSPYSPVAAL